MFLLKYPENRLYLDLVLFVLCSKPLEFELSSQFLEFSTYYLGELVYHERTHVECPRGMTNLFSLFLENTFIFPGEIIDIPQYGQMKPFYVTTVQGDHGTFSLETSLNSCNTSLADDFTSLKIDNNATESVINSSCSNTSNEPSLDVRNISTYYSFCDESFHHDTHDNQEYPSSESLDVMFTSTPVKAKSTNNFCDISCSRCSPATVAYYVTAAATKVIINQSEGSQKKPRHVTEKLTYDSVGGLQQQIRTLKEIVELSIRSPGVFQSYGKSLLVTERLKPSINI